MFRTYSCLPWWCSGKNHCQFRSHGFKPWLGENSLRGNGNPVQYFFAWESQGQRRLVATVSGIAEESDTTEWPAEQEGLNWIRLPRWISGQESACWECRRHRLDPCAGKMLSEGNGTAHRILLPADPMTMEPGRLHQGSWDRVGHDWESKQQLLH